LLCINFCIIVTILLLNYGKNMKNTWIGKRKLSAHSVMGVALLGISLLMSAPAKAAQFDTCEGECDLMLGVDPRIDEIQQHIAHHHVQLTHATEALNKLHTLGEGVQRHLEGMEHQVSTLQDKIQTNDKKVLRGIASTAALSNAIQPSAPGKTVIGMGAASYEGVHAFALTLSHRPEKLSQMSLQGGIGTSGHGKSVMRVGINYQF
jgi:autotransporter adhesin